MLTQEVVIANTDRTENGRLSWRCLLEEAVTKPGTVHEAYSRFWNYSLGNQILALMQCRARVIEPGPLASFNRWTELGRHVRKGQRALELCMPLKLKAKEWDAKRLQDSPAPTGDGEEPGCRTIFVFKKNWFVLSQTEGAPYEPEPIPAWDKVAALAALNIREENFAVVDGNTQGYAATGTATVAISPIAAMPHKTLFHEIAHVLLHHGGDDTERSLREVEAECVAMICCESLGLTGVEFSRGYVQHWLCVDSIPEKSAQRIFQAADSILKSGKVRVAQKTE
jgi:antirestriction protein ArdC